MINTSNISANSRDIITRGLACTSSARADLEGTYDFVLAKGQGAYVWDMEGKKYIDYTASTGAIILGYNNEVVNNFLIEHLKNNGSMLPTTISEIHVNLAEKLLNYFKGLDRVLFYRTGSCATTAAVRLARVYSNKKVVLTSGYHGWHDWHLNIFPRFKIQDSNYIDFRYNLNLLESAIETNKDNIACVIITPEPNFFDAEYFKEIREICNRHSIILIFDEVMCGFRYKLGGFYSKIGVIPDMVTIGKGLANGFALSAVIGKKEIMVARDNTHLVGTFHNDQSPMAAAIATIHVLESENVVSHLEKMGNILMNGLNKMFINMGLAAKAYRNPSLFHIIFEDLDFEEAFYKKMHSYGILFHPFDPQMVNFSHTEQDIAETLNKVEIALKELKQSSPNYFNSIFNGNLSQEAIDFRTLHEFGGTINYRSSLGEVLSSWDQKDR